MKLFVSVPAVASVSNSGYLLPLQPLIGAGGIVCAFDVMAKLTSDNISIVIEFFIFEMVVFDSLILIVSP